MVASVRLLKRFLTAFEACVAFSIALFCAAAAVASTLPWPGLACSSSSLASGFESSESTRRSSRMRSASWASWMVEQQVQRQPMQTSAQQFPGMRCISRMVLRMTTGGTQQKLKHQSLCGWMVVRTLAFMQSVQKQPWRQFPSPSPQHMQSPWWNSRPSYAREPLNSRFLSFFAFFSCLRVSTASTRPRRCVSASSCAAEQQQQNSDEQRSSVQWPSSS
eukprot:Amastigsp_a510097_58.p4 type:complete len:219 gc:universal Amastigsp_a510097_58:91-747(+)